MPARFKPLWPALRACADVLLLLGCWALWIALGIGLAVQIGIGSSHELAVPKFALRSLEERFAASHVNVRFGRATFDPAGRILLEQLQLSLPEFTEPIVTARAVYLQLDPWALAIGRFVPRRVQATGIELFAPAMLTPSGRSEGILTNLDFDLAPGDSIFELRHLTAQLAGVIVEAHGTLQVPRSRVTGGGAAPLPLIETLATRYVALSRQLIRLAAALTDFDHPELHATLTPSPPRGAIASIALTARSVNLTSLLSKIAPNASREAKPGGLDLQGLKISGLGLNAHIPLLGAAPDAAPLTVTVEEVQTDQGLALHRAVARLNGELRLDPFSYQLRNLEGTAAEVSARGFVVRALIARVQPGPASELEGNLTATLSGSPVAASGRVNLDTRAARLRFDGALSPALLDPVCTLIGRDVRPFIGFGAPVALGADVTFAAGWKFAGLTGRIWATKIDAYHVLLDAAGGEIEFDGRHFVARRALAVVGDSFARGTFEQDLTTSDFRFLLEGKLRPLAIGEWFHDWWPDFFSHFEFPNAPPSASVDVRGRWRTGRETTVFLFAEGSPAIIRGAALDYVRTLLFIRPNFYDGQEVFAIRGVGDLRGTFTRRVDIDTNEWSQMALTLDSTLELETATKLLGPSLADNLDPFTFEHAPHVQFSGLFDGPAATSGPHETMQIRAQSTGAFTLYRFPARNLSFNATVHDGDLVLDRVEANVAGGTLTGKAHLSATNPKRLTFDAAVRGANLAQAIAALRSRVAPPGTPDPGTGKVVPDQTNVKLEVSLAAEGQFENPFSYHGTGSAALDGARLGEVRLLGLLSDLLNFTALRFTTARGDFTLDGTSLAFPSVSVTGANSAIQARGTYALDRHELDFKARVYPFQESKSLLQSMMGAVLTPLSTVLEVKLTGPLEQPHWAFVIGPTNFLRNLAQPQSPASAPSPNEPGPYLRRQSSPEDAKTH